MSSLVIPRLSSLLAVVAGLLVSFTPTQAPAQSAQANTLAGQRFLTEHPALHLPAQTNRVAAGASMADRARVEGHVPAFAKTKSVSGAPDPDSPLSLTALLNRSPEVQAAFEDLLAKQQDPASPLYHQWLTPQQVGALFGPTDSDVDAVVSWLGSVGFTVDSVDPSRTRIHFSTTFGAAANAFKTSFANYTVGTGTLYSVTEEPSLPVALSGVLGSVVGLSEVKVYSNLRQGTFDPSAYSESSGVRPMYTGGSGNHYLAPGDFNTIYDITPVLAAGYTGSGQRIAIIGQSQVTALDITNYKTLFGLANTTVNTVIPTTGADPGTSSAGDKGEQTLDVERVIAAAPGATVDLVVSKQVGNNSGLGIALDWNVNNLVDKIMSISYGTCEAQYSASDAASDNSYFSQAASEGITTLISSGDSGVTGCYGFSGLSATAQATPAINGLCGSQYVTCVGGTEFAEGSSTGYWASSNGTTYSSALSYIPEGAWNDPSYTTSSGTVYQQAASGGGPSAYIAKPSWQVGTGVPADGKRDVPDISFSSSANHDGYLICFATASTTSSCAFANGSSLAVYGGTSAAAPGMAGIVALMNQRLGNTTGYGNLNPMLYSLSASASSAFHDTTVASSGVTSCTASTPSLCNNSTPGTNSLSGGTAGYLVTPGYDLVTGLGSLDVNNFVTAISASTGSFSLSANPSTLSIVAGATTGNTDAITVTSSNGFAGSVALTCSVVLTTGTATIPPTCALNPASVTLTSGGNASSTATITTTAGTTNCVSSSVSPASGARGFEIALAGLLFLALPFRRRGLAKGLMSLGFVFLMLLTLNGCGKGGTATTPCSNVVSGRTTQGTYTVTISGSGTSSGSSTAITNSTTFTVTVN